MQIKKEEIRQKILEAATDEFMKKGYENASMRVIASKAHTTLGNIYHYFSNKEVLLETIVLPTFENIEASMEQHMEKAKAKPLTKQEALNCVNDLDIFFYKSELKCFFDKRIVILLKLESSHLLERKEKFLEKMLVHLQEHFNMKEDSHYPKIILNVLADCLKHVLTEHESIEDAQAEFITLFRVFCTGVIGQMKE